MAKDVRVGLVGVNARTGWARESHVPAVQAVDGLTLAAVATRDQRTADEAAAATGAPLAFGDPMQLVASPDVDLVTVASPVPSHLQLIAAALDAGKQVLIEWPVGVDTEQTAQIAQLAARAGTAVHVNLQARQNLAAHAAKRMLDAGEIGRLLGVSVLSTTAGWRPSISAAAASLENAATGMNLLTIQHAHSLDLVTQLVGPIVSLAALTSVQYPEPEVGDPPRRQRRVVADHILVQGELVRDSAWLDVRVAGGRPPEDSPFALTLVGTDAVLELLGGGPRGFQAGLLALTKDGEPVAVPQDRDGRLAPSAVNVAGTYRELVDRMRQGHQHGHLAGTADAVALARLLDAVMTSAGTRRTVDVTG